MKHESKCSGKVHTYDNREIDVVLEKASCRVDFALWTMMTLFIVVYVKFNFSVGLSINVACYPLKELFHFNPFGKTNFKQLLNLCAK